MQLPLKTQIAGLKTVEDWNRIRLELNDYTNNNIWASAFNDFFLERIKERYLNPIESIKQNGSNTGEGFSIMTIICSLIEFLETIYQGRNYRYRNKKDPVINPLIEYSVSGEIFISFLTSKSPFNEYFDIDLADEFYKKIRCGLLHEARTKGKWTIWGSSNRNILIKIETENVIVYRNDFYTALNDYINKSYKMELLKSDERKIAFLRKFDNLCLE